MRVLLVPTPLADLMFQVEIFLACCHQTTRGANGHGSRAAGTDVKSYKESKGCHARILSWKQVLEESVVRRSGEEDLSLQCLNTVSHHLHVRARVSHGVEQVLNRDYLIARCGRHRESCSHNAQEPGGRCVFPK